MRICKDCGITDEEYENSWIEHTDIGQYQCFDCYEEAYNHYMSDEEYRF